MEDLFSVVIVIIGVIASIAASAKKAKDRNAAEERHKAAVAQRVNAAQQKMAAEAVRSALPTAVSALTSVMSAVQVAQPQVHVHLQPDCDTHDAPGSTGTVSNEGKDPCHAEQLTMTHTFSEESEPGSGLTFDWSGENMVKAFVMQEVFTRPANRAPAARRTPTCQRRAQ